MLPSQGQRVKNVGRRLVNRSRMLFADSIDAANVNSLGSANNKKEGAEAPSRITRTTRSYQVSPAPLCAALHLDVDDLGRVRAENA